MVMPSGWRNSYPTPVPTASGNPPSSAAMVVIMIGRKRSMQASKIASCGDLPSRRSASRAKSIIMMAFFFTMPISRMIPISPMTLSSLWVSKRASRAPTPAEGRVENRDRVDKTLVQNSQHDVNREQRSCDQNRLIGEGLLVSRRSSLKAGVERGRKAKFAFGGIDGLRGLTEGNVGREIERNSRGRELALVIDGEGSVSRAEMSDCR